MNASQRIQAAAVRALAALPARAKRRLAGPPVNRDGLELDLDAQLVIRFNERSGRPPVEQRTPEQARADMRHSAPIAGGRPVELAEVRDIDVKGAAGRLDARLYVPAEAQGTPGPLVVFFHGGGWVIGDIDTHDASCRLLAQASGARVLSVDYRLAPEHPYPAPVDDALAAFRDAVARAGELGADPDRIAVAGDSAGGHLSALVAQRAAADGGPAPAYQVLIYPVTELVDDYPSKLIFAEGFLLTKASMDWYEAHLLSGGGDAGEASPLRTERLDGVAPAFIVTAGFDPLRDEGEAYAARLRDAGVPAVLRRHPGQIHGFFNMPGIGRGPRDAIIEIGGVLRTALAAR
ncbi:MAG TPA: alpha/beta hydrolase fold domain-containing protein [Solirubrobacteraceae bacterium]|jgi:acetyl esterase|nr:alpha/beta hydrolase fold domain-containing protein [Solirubrobacteraceae bacterium]